MSCFDLIAPLNAMNRRKIIPGLLIPIAGIFGWQAIAQTCTTLHSFSSNGPEGTTPVSPLIVSDSTLYGMTEAGGSSGQGTVFKLKNDGSGFKTLYDFTGGADGGSPFASLTLAGTTLYGTTGGGGTSGCGTVFALQMDGSGFASLYSFLGGDDGSSPMAGLLLSGTMLYGTTYQGGYNNLGTLFAIDTNGTSYRVLHAFTGPDGAQPFGSLIVSNDTLYGTTHDGTVFRVNTDGSDFRTLYTFTRLKYNTNSDGAFPYGGLVLSGNTLYGTAQYGGAGGNGTIFKVNTDGAGFQTLHNFAPTVAGNGNADGAVPQAGLIISGNTLYGTARSGGDAGYGTVFSVKTDGTEFVVLHKFVMGEGFEPFSELLLSGSTLYGTTYAGGAYNHGTVFNIFVPPWPPRLTLISSRANTVLTWPTNPPGFALQYATNLGRSAFWTTSPIPPVVVNGQNTVTNQMSILGRFFRLCQ
jgi:uncharacterized repeat protein (TIGR03803 family)